MNNHVLGDYLAGLGPEVTAYDISTVGLEKTKQLAKRHGVQVDTVVKDLTRDEVAQEEYDLALLIYGHVPKKDQASLMKQVMNSVKPGGYILLELYSQEQLLYKTGGPGTVDMLYDPQQLLDLFDAHHFLHFYYGEASRYEGIRHRGLGHVIQLFVKKD